MTSEPFNPLAMDSLAHSIVTRMTEMVPVPLGESAVIRQHRPVWNVIVDGFGNHDPGSGRGKGVRSRWDTLHPGRSWADKYPQRKETASHIVQEIREYLRSRLA